ncbi:MAG TPA: zinc-dependent metalloprotease family protein [Phycisphaerales bacterium]|nr:zinc-dependent metalloprotease family protein [Phycisphaerales bacterium]
MKLFALALVSALTGVAVGQPAFTVMHQPPSVDERVHVPGPRPTRGNLARVEPGALSRDLAGAPMERVGEDLTAYGLMVELPHPDGGMTACFVAESPIMEPGLSAKFPAFKTYIVQSVDETAGGRLEVTPRGLTGMLRATRADGSGGAWMIDLWQSADPTHVIAYWMRDLPNSIDWECHTAADPAPAVEEPGAYSPRVLRSLKTLRLAVACTGEYGVHHSGLQGHAPNVADPLAAIVTVVGRTNVVFENDLAVRFVLVANNDQLVFIDPATDPYTLTCAGEAGADCSYDLLNPNQSTIDSVIGTANYDVGHLLTRVFGGVASLNSVCGGSKARGISGIPRGGDIDPFSALVPIHELGHQFGAAHTFSGVQGRCQGNVSTGTAWEAGSGSSPMAYAGGCPVGDAAPSDNVAIFADPWFHSGSIQQMRAFVDGQNFTCASITTSDNNVPVITSLPPNQAIPLGTPFVLTATAADEDNDPLTYSWEQFDAGVARPLIGGTDNGSGSLFRIFPPVADAWRTFPRMADVLAGIATPGERLPTWAGVQRRFRVVVRDNRAGTGGTAVSTQVLLTIRGPGNFAFTAPAQNAIVRGATPTTVTWSVAMTNVTPISCPTVVLRLSTDGGATFPTVVGSFPNSGSAVVTLPDVPQPVAARLRIEGEGRVFFNVSRPFDLRPACSADYNRDGDTGTDQDIEAFFACLGGHCCATCPQSADFNGDGDIGTDQDIESFFRVLGGGAC